MSSSATKYSSIGNFVTSSASIESVEQIIKAATKLFSSMPVKMVSVSMICEEAGVKKPLLFHHFKTKDKLYKIVFDRVIGFHIDHMRIIRRQWISRKNIDREEAIAMFFHLVNVVMDGLYNPDFEEDWPEKIALSETVHPSPFYEEFYQKFFRKHYEMVGRIIMTITGDSNFKIAAFQGITIFGQIVSFRIERELMIRLLDMKGFSNDELVDMKKMVIRNTLLILGLDPNYKIQFELLKKIGMPENKINAHSTTFEDGEFSTEMCNFSYEPLLKE